MEEVGGDVREGCGNVEFADEGETEGGDFQWVEVVGAVESKGWGFGFAGVPETGSCAVGVFQGLEEEVHGVFDFRF